MPGRWLSSWSNCKLSAHNHAFRNFVDSSHFTGPQVLKGPFDPTGLPVGCKSACIANLDGNQGVHVCSRHESTHNFWVYLANSSNCCSGSHSTPATCPSSGESYALREFVIDYSYFKKAWLTTAISKEIAQILTRTLMMNQALLLFGSAILPWRLITRSLSVLDEVSFIIPIKYTITCCTFFLVLLCARSDLFFLTRLPWQYWAH